MFDLVPGEDPQLAVLHGQCDVVCRLENSIALIVSWEVGDGVDVVGLAFLNVVVVEGRPEVVLPADLGRQVELASFRFRRPAAHARAAGECDENSVSNNKYTIRAEGQWASRRGRRPLLVCVVAMGTLFHLHPLQDPMDPDSARIVPPGCKLKGSQACKYDFPFTFYEHLLEKTVTICEGLGKLA